MKLKDLNIQTKVKKLEESSKQRLKSNPRLSDLYNLVEMFDTPAPHTRWEIHSTREMYKFGVGQYSFAVFLEHRPEQIKRTFGFSRLGSAPVVQIMVGQYNSGTKEYHTEIMNNVGVEAIKVFSIAQDAIARRIGTEGIFVFAAKRSKEDSNELAFNKRVQLYGRLAEKLAQKHSLDRHPEIVKNSRGDIIYIVSKYDLSKELGKVKHYGVHET